MPDLSQLIHACPRFDELSHQGSERFCWFAKAGEMMGVGETPEEAVAELWLEQKGIVPSWKRPADWSLFGKPLARTKASRRASA